jgi:hypothetical protein
MRIQSYAPRTGTTAEVPNASSDGYALPDPIEQLATGDLAAQLAAMMWKLSSEQKQVTRDLENTYDKMQDQAEQRQVEHKRDKADASMVEGILTGIAEMGAGGLTIGAGASLTESPGAAKECEGLAKLTEGVGKLAATFFHAKAEHLDADATASEHASAWAKRSAERMHEDARDLEKSISDALELYRDYCKASIDGKKAAIHAA